MRLVRARAAAHLSWWRADLRSDAVPRDVGKGRPRSDPHGWLLDARHEDLSRLARLSRRRVPDHRRPAETGEASDDRADGPQGLQAFRRDQRGDRKSVVWGTMVSVRVDPGGRRIIN